MKRFVEGVDRWQATLFPECLEDWIDEDNPVRVKLQCARSRSIPNITHEVTNDGSDRAQLANVACRAKEVLGVDELEAVADRGYYSSEEILTCAKWHALLSRQHSSF